MASAMRKMAVYLGLVEDDHRFEDQYQDEYGDEYDEYGAELVQEDDRLDAHLADGPADEPGGPHGEVLDQVVHPDQGLIGWRAIEIRHLPEFDS